MKKLPKFFPESTTLLCSTENYGKIKEKKKERCKMFAKKYSVLLLDADNTLFDFDASEARALQLAMEECALPFAPEYVAVYHRINDAKWKQLERGEITREQLVVERFAEFLQEIGGDSDKLAQLSEAYPRRLGQQRIPFPRAEEICAKLAEHFTLAIITNGNTNTQHGRFDTWELLPKFHGIYISEQIGLCKPEKAYFDYVLQDIGATDRDGVLVIGDSLSSDIMGGINAGLDTCWFNPQKKSAPEHLRPTYEISRLEELIQLIQ